MNWPDGKKYEGEWKDDKRSGKGKQTWSQGDKAGDWYDGEWVEGDPHEMRKSDTTGRGALVNNKT